MRYCRTLFFVFFLLLATGAFFTACSSANDELPDLPTAVSATETIPPTMTAEPTAVSVPTTIPPTEEAVKTAVADSQWTRTNPGGGGAFNVIGGGPRGAAGEPGILLAGSDLTGAYISYNQGENWEVIGSVRGLQSTHVSGIGFDASDADVLFLGTDDGLFRSGDAGATVQWVLQGGYITDIETAVSNPSIGYASYHSDYDHNDGAVYKTEDNGRSWQQISNQTLPDGLHILKLIIDPEDENVLYILTGEGRFTCGAAAVYESADGGQNWEQIGQQLGQIIDIALDPNDPNRLYATSYGDVWDEGYRCVQDDFEGGFLYRGTFSGDWSWEQLTDETKIGSRNMLIWLDADDNAIRLLDIVQLELWESVDDGGAWSLVSSGETWESGWTEHPYGGSFNGDALTIGTDMSDPDALLWIDSQFAFSTRDNGRFFAPLYTKPTGDGAWQSTGIDNIVMVDLAIDADSTHLYASLGDMGCFRSDDYGGGWKPCNDPAYTGWWENTGGNVATLEADPVQAGSLWITQAPEMDGFSHTLLHSVDFGASWRAVTAWGDDVVPSGLSVDAASDAHNRTLFLTVGGEVWRGKSDGSGWTAVFSCGGCRYTAVRQYDDALVLFAGGEAGLYRSTDGGDSWQEVGLPEMRGDLGDSFLSSYWAGVAAVEFDPSAGCEAWVYATVYGAGGGLYRSMERGEAGSWQKILDDDFMKRVAISPADGDVIFATSSSGLYSGGYDAASGGVWRTVDGGANWQQVNEGLPWPFANPIAIDGKRPFTVFLGSPGAGFYLRDFGEAKE